MQIGSLEEQALVRNETIEQLGEVADEKNTKIGELQKSLDESNVQISIQESRFTNLEKEYYKQGDILFRHQNELIEIYTSKSWLLTKPVRLFCRVCIKTPLRLLRGLLARIAKVIYKLIPLSSKSKISLKNRVLNSIGQTTRPPKSQSKSADSPLCSNNGAVLDSPHTPNKFVELSNCCHLDSGDLRVIAFYLPQFHEIPENNEWWGDGFTEWTNVKPAKPQFEGHNQPRIPGELGYYDLSDPSVQKRQVELAKLHGVSGFCFYHYWFGGTRLLEKPVENYLNDKTLDFPYCLCWANENWSRRWDGLDNEILISQQHSDEDDIAFIEALEKHLKDDRYIKINGRPLILVYRPNLLPSPTLTAKRWRNWCKENGVGDIYLAYTQSFEKVDPKEYGFDAAIEFPPNNSGPPDITNEVASVNSDFNGTIFDWQVFMQRSERFNQEGYKLFRGVTPSWDNTARRGNEATVFVNNSPAEYEEWLARAILDTKQNVKNPDEQILFVNAWNEWAEGAYLEPDKEFGYAYLQATRNAIEICSQVSNDRIVLVGHDAHPHGAQMLLLYLARFYNLQLKFNVDVILLGDGPLRKEYEEYSNVHLLSSQKDFDEEVSALVQNLRQLGARHAITNTAVSGCFSEILKNEGFVVTSLIHELPGVIKQFELETHIEKIAKYSDTVVFPSTQAADGFQLFQELTGSKIRIQPQGLFRKNKFRTKADKIVAKSELRNKFGLPDDAIVVLCVGYADHRKGIDLFTQIAKLLCNKRDNVYFVWVGHSDETLMPEINRFINENKLAERVIFPGLDFNSDVYYAGADVYALTSREDPFPSVVLEALDAGLPIVMFDGVSGSCDIVKRSGGTLVPQFDLKTFSSAINTYFTNLELTDFVSNRSKAIVSEEFSFRKYALDLLSTGFGHKKVSVVIPNYNYDNYLHERINSVVLQDYPIWEIILLDDGSTDGSVEILEDITNRLDIDCKLVVNDSNSGSVFRQWKKGVELATGDFIWIAEADDLSEKSFLTAAMRGFEHPHTVLSYTESKQIGTNGEVLCNNYLNYVKDVSSNKWSTDYMNSGYDEIKTALAIKNTIPNVSAAVFKKSCFQQVLNKHLDEICNYKVAGDWVTYLYLLEKGDLSFSSKPLNKHRRHEQSVTLGSFDETQLDEILRVQQFAREHFEIDNRTIEKAKSYAEVLYNQFGLNTSDYPDIENHPKLSLYFGVST